MKFSVKMFHASLCDQDLILTEAYMIYLSSVKKCLKVERTVRLIASLLLDMLIFFVKGFFGAFQ